jgi:hypothetical protein
VKTPDIDGPRLTAKKGVAWLAERPLQLGEQYSPFISDRFKPGEKKTYYANGPAGVTFSVTLSRDPNTGGHYHGGATSDPLAVGTIVPSQLTFVGAEPQNVPCVWTAPDVCGSVRLDYRFSSGEYGWWHMDIMYDSFLPIPQSTGISLKTPDPIHPSPYWADPPFISKLRLLGEKYAAKTGKDIVITDASLPWGGRFDIEAEHPQHPTPWRAPHAEHRNGRQADVRLRDMTASDRIIFQDACIELGIEAQIHSDNHWHIRLP